MKVFDELVQTLGVFFGLVPPPPIGEKCDNKDQCKKRMIPKRGSLYSINKPSKYILCDSVKIIAKINGGLN